MQSLPGYHQNDFVATQALGNMMYVMYSELFIVYKNLSAKLLYVYIYMQLAGFILETGDRIF